MIRPFCGTGPAFIFSQDTALSPRETSFVKLFINGDYRGVYLNVEHIDDEFLQKRFIDDDQGNLYKASWGADLNYWGTNANSYTGVYELKTNKDSNDYGAFISFLDSLNNLSDDDFPCYMERNFEVNHYLKTLAAEIIIGHWDGHAYNKNNFYLYRQPSNGKFVFIEYDLDNTFGIDWFGIDWANRDLNAWHQSNRPLVERLLEIPYYKDVFNAHLDTLLTDLDTSNWYSDLEAQQNLIKSAVQSDTYYPKDYGFQFSDFLDALDDNYGAHVKKGLAEYLDERITSGLSQVDWIGTLEPPCDELPIEPERKIIKIVDFIGRETHFRTDIPLIISLLFGLITFVILGGAFGSLVFLPEMAGWYEAYPEAVRETPDFVSGLVVGLLQLIALIILLPKLQITTVSGGAIFGAIYSVVLWLMVDLQMVSVTNIVSYDYVLKDALLSAVMGAVLGLVITWSQKKFA